MRKWTLYLGLLVLTAFVLAACGSVQSGAQPANDIMSDNMDADMSDDMNDSMNDDMNDEMTEDDMDNSMSDNNMEDDDMSEDAHGDMAEGSDDDMMDEDNEDDMMEDESASEDMMTADTPEWFDYEFVDARTGETFTINDFHGKVVMVETMAMWCSNCLKQQGIVKEFHSALGERDDFVAIGLDIDPNEDLVRLADYVQGNGFDWLYGVPSADVTAEISRTFGPQYLNPPSTPIAIIDKDGGIHTLPFGIKSVDDLLGYVNEYLN